MNKSIGLLTAENVEIPLTGVQVEGDLAGRGARLTIRQKYRNSGNNAVEAVYKFPLPESCAVAGFRIWIGEKRIEGAVEERDVAFEKYDDALIRGDGAYLMDEERPNVFTLSAGNLNPGMEATIELDLVLLMDFEGNKYRLTLPTTISPRYVPDDLPADDGIPVSDLVNPVYAPEVPYGLSLLLRIHHTGKLSAVESPSHPVRVTMEKKRTIVELTHDSTRMDRDFVLVIDPGEMTKGRAFRQSDGKNTFWQLDLAVSGPENMQVSDPGEMIFLLDCSGSMAGESILQAKKALEVCLKALPANSTFNVYLFGSTFKAFFQEPQMYSESSLSAALRQLEQTGADLGGTEMYAPFQAIYRSSPNSTGRNIILLTDGEIGNEQQLLDLVRSKRTHTRVYPIGIGAGPNEHLIKGLARAGDGSAEFVFPGERIEPKVLRIFSHTGSPVIKDLQIHWDDAPAEQAPAQQAVFIGQSTTFFARGPLTQKDPSRIKVTGSVAENPFEWIFNVEQLSPKNLPLPQLWARERIRDLEEQSSDSGSQQRQRKENKHKDQIIEISKACGILSRYTSYLGIESRLEKDKTAGPVELRKIPTLVTTGWHGGIMPKSALYSAIDSSMAMNSPVYDEKKPARSISTLFKEAVSFSRPARKVHAIDHTDVLMAVLGTQQINGGFLLDDQIAKLLKLELKQLRKQADQLKTIQPNDAFLVVCTVLVFGILETHFAPEAATWQPITEKSRKWLEKIMDTGINGDASRALSEWANKIVAGKIKTV